MFYFIYDRVADSSKEAPAVDTEQICAKVEALGGLVLDKFDADAVSKDAVNYASNEVYIPYILFHIFL